MTEKQLVSAAASNSVRVYGMSKYFIDKDASIPEATVLIGYAAMREDELGKAVQLLFGAWFK